MAKKDFGIRENVDRGAKEEPNALDNTKESLEPKPDSKTEVKNANASGQGSLGRNDQENEDAGS